MERNSRSNSALNAEIAQRWMEMVLNEKFLQDFVTVLQDGHVLVALLNKLYKALGMKHLKCEGRISEDPNPTKEDEENVSYQNIQLYLSSCQEHFRVRPEDCFDPLDLIEARDLDKVYHNILALQEEATLISSRRSIDERNSVDFGSQRIAIEQAPFLGEDFFANLSDTESAENSQHQAWKLLLDRYKSQQQTKAKDSGFRINPDETAGLGKLAHDIWCTEEKIRALLLQEDPQFGLVPNDLHGKLWMLASGAEMEMRRRPGFYLAFVEMEQESTENTRQIDADLHRTISDVDKPVWSEVKTQMMRRILVAYSFFNPTLGYCQGLNYIVSRMLMFLGEEESFFLLMKMIQLVPEDYYTSMLGLAVDQHVFADLVRLQTPSISIHLSELGGTGMELSLACTEWFLTLFASPCKKEVTVRIWDSIFLLGDEVLFRVALALMQNEKEVLLTCDNYGDMLKHLNELGRENVDAIALMQASSRQDLVIRARIEDFRAHHRLQLASGIAASSLQGVADQSKPPSSRGTNTGTSSKHHRKRKQGIFKHLEKHHHLNRFCRTFDRYLTDDYSEALQREHPNICYYYDKKPPNFIERYWTSNDSYQQWDRVHYELIAPTPEEIQLFGDTMARPVSANADVPGRSIRSTMNTEDSTTGSVATSLPSNMYTSSTPSHSEFLSNFHSANMAMVHSKGISRERRSKSTAFIHLKKHAGNGQHGHHRPQNKSSTDDDLTHVGRSGGGFGWIQKLEDWHKEMKSNKERKKAEKQKQKQRELEQQLQDQSQQLYYSPSLEIHNDACENERLVNTEIHTTSQPNFFTDEHPLSKSSPDVMKTGLYDTQNRFDEMGSEILLRSNMNDVVINDHFSGSQPQLLASTLNAQDQVQRGGLEFYLEEKPSMPKAGGDEFVQSSGLTSTHSFSSPSLPSLENSSEKTPRYILGHHQARLPVSPTQITGINPSAASGLVQELMWDPSQQPSFRRQASLPVSGDKRLYRPGSSKRMHPDMARLMRDRVHVVSYMQRKASDASSIGSLNTHRDTATRVSNDSSESSHVSESTRKSSASSNLRKNSFSFFEKLSLDVESSIGDLYSQSDEVYERRLESSINSDYDVPLSDERKITDSGSDSTTRSHILKAISQPSSSSQ